MADKKIAYIINGMFDETVSITQRN